MRRLSEAHCWLTGWLPARKSSGSQQGGRLSIYSEGEGESVRERIYAGIQSSESTLFLLTLLLETFCSVYPSKAGGRVFREGMAERERKSEWEVIDILKCVISSLMFMTICFSDSFECPGWWWSSEESFYVGRGCIKVSVVYWHNSCPWSETQHNVVRLLL